MYAVVRRKTNHENICPLAFLTPVIDVDEFVAPSLHLLCDLTRPGAYLAFTIQIM